MRNHREDPAGKKGGFIRNLIMVSGSNILQLIANIALGLLLPALLSIEDFGFYKVYTLYIGYCGLMHFGFVDGILLKFGGQDFDSLEQCRLRTYTKLFFFCEAVCSLLVFVFGVILFDGVYQIIALLVSSNLVLSNMTLYYQYLSQATSRFREFSFRKTLNSLLTILTVVVLVLARWFGSANIPFWTVVAAMQGISLGLLLWYIWTYRDITFGKGLPVKSVTVEIAQLCKKGIMLTLAYEVAQFMMLLDRQFVSVLFPVEVYAQYAFAYNILSCVTALITAISTVMFPMLKRMNRDKVMKLLPLGVSVVTILVCFALTGYYIVVILVNILLPQYVDSLIYFRIVFPAIALSSSITIVMFTFYKVLDRIRSYFLNSCLGLAVSFVLNIAAYWIWKTPVAISIASVISIIIWYILVSISLSRICGVKWKKNFVYALTVMMIFYLLTAQPWSMAIKCFLYFVFVCIISYIGYPTILQELKNVNGR